MNKRIRELADQAELTVRTGKGTYMSHPEFNKKFAELILQDIDAVIDELYRALPLEQAAVLLTLDENIKQHFYGVEL